MWSAIPSRLAGMVGQSGSKTGQDGAGASYRAMRVALTSVAVLAILVAIGFNTLLATREAHEENTSLQALRASNRLKGDLDQLQQFMLETHDQVYILVGTKAYYVHSAFEFPLRALLDLTGDARTQCRSNAECVSRMDDLDEASQKLDNRTQELVQRVSKKPGSVRLGDPLLSEIDALFYGVLANVVEVRMAVDTSVDEASCGPGKRGRSGRAIPAFLRRTSAADLDFRQQHVRLCRGESRGAARLRLLRGRASRNVTL